MKNLDKANEWLQRAKSNMARAKSGRVSPDILYEDLCYDAQYMTELPKRELLEQKLHKAVELARKRLEAKPA